MKEGMAVMALNPNWMDAVEVSGTAMLWGKNDGYQQVGSITGSSMTYTQCLSCNSWPCCCHHHTVTYRYWPYQVEGRKIRLTLSEVDTLRAACKKDKDLRAVLQKLTPHVEVEVTL